MRHSHVILKTPTGYANNPNIKWESPRLGGVFFVFLKDAQNKGPTLDQLQNRPSQAILVIAVSLVHSLT